MNPNVPFCWRFLKVLPSVALSILILGTYTGYLCTFVIPLIFKSYPEKKFIKEDDQFWMGVCYLSISGVFLFLVIYSLMRAALTDPGKIPEKFQREKMDEALNYLTTDYASANSEKRRLFHQWQESLKYENDLKK